MKQTHDWGPVTYVHLKQYFIWQSVYSPVEKGRQVRVWCDVQTKGYIKKLNFILMVQFSGFKI